PFRSGYLPRSSTCATAGNVAGNIHDARASTNIFNAPRNSIAALPSISTKRVWLRWNQETCHHRRRANASSRPMAISSWRPDRSSRLQAEDVEHVRDCHVLELRHLRENVVTQARADQHGDILLAVDRIGDRGRIDAGANIEAPHLLQRLGVVG